MNTYIQSDINQIIQNVHFAQLKRFKEWCIFFKIEPTTRQASKFRNRRGLLFNKMILNPGKFLR